MRTGTAATRKSSPSGAGPNRFLVAEVAELEPGRALDLACGEGGTPSGSQASAGRSRRSTSRTWRSRRGGNEQPERASRSGSARSTCSTSSPKRGRTSSSSSSTCRFPRASGGGCSPAPRRTVADGGTLILVGHDLLNLTEGSAGRATRASCTRRTPSSRSFLASRSRRPSACCATSRIRTPGDRRARTRVVARTPHRRRGARLHGSSPRRFALGSGVGLRVVGPFCEELPEQGELPGLADGDERVPCWM